MGIAKSILLIAGSLAAIGIVVTALALTETHRRIAALESARFLAGTRHGLIEYQVWGDGPPVLVIHGAGGGYDQGRLLVEAVGPAGYRWISASRFGYLGSAMPDTPSTAAQAEAFADLLDEIGIERVSILAMSGGAPPALKFAELFPNRTERMVLLSPAPFTPFSPVVESRPVPAWFYSVLLGNDVVYWCLTKVARGSLENAFDARPELRTDLSASEERFVRDLIDDYPPASRRIRGINNEGAAVHPDAIYDLEAIRAPALVVHARDDRLNPVQVSETIASRIESAEFTAFETGGHLLLGHHGQLAIDIDKFLKANTGQPPAQ